MKNSILFYKFLIVSLAMLLVSGCESVYYDYPNHLNSQTVLTEIETEATETVEINAVRVTQIEEISTNDSSGIFVAHTDTSNNTDTISYSYQLPDICKGISWEYEYSEFTISFEYITDESQIDTIIPVSVLELAKEKMQRDFELESNSERFAYFYYSIYDINQDGLSDYFIKILPEKEHNNWRSRFSTGIYVSSTNGYFTVDCDLNFKHISIMPNKTNGLNDILTGYFGNDICKYNGIDRYTYPNNSIYGGSEYELCDNDVIKISILLGEDYTLESATQYYVVMLPEDNDFLNHKLLYASNQNGIPLLVDSNTYTRQFDFYSDLKSAEVHTIWFKQLKFIPVSDFS